MINKMLIENDIKSAIDDVCVRDKYVFKFKSMHGFMFKYNNMIYIIEYHNEDFDDSFYICLYDVFHESVCGSDYINDNKLFFIEIINVNETSIISKLNCFLNVDIEAMINIDNFSSIATSIYYDYFSFDPELDDCKLLPKLDCVKVKSI